MFLYAVDSVLAPHFPALALPVVLIYHLMNQVVFGASLKQLFLYRAEGMCEDNDQNNWTITAANQNLHFKANLLFFLLQTPLNVTKV